VTIGRTDLISSGSTVRGPRLDEANTEQSSRTTGLAGKVVLDPAAFTLLVTGGTFVLFAFELVPPEITAMTAAAVLMLGDAVMEPALFPAGKSGFSGFSNPATITVLSMFVIAAGVQRTGVVNRAAHKVLDFAQGSSKRFLLALLVSVGVASAFLNNTPIVAIFIPLVVTVATRLERSPSKFLIPLSFAAILGGTLTLIGTSTNVLASGIAQEFPGIEAFDMFLFTKVGIVLLPIGIAYLILVAPALLPERHKVGEVTERHQLRDYVFEVVVEPGSPLVGQTVEDSGLKRNFDIDILRIFREEQPIDPPLVGVELDENDILLVRASREQLLQVRDAEGLAMKPEVTHGRPGESGETFLIEAIVMPGSMLEGSTLESSKFLQRYNATVLSVKKRERLFRSRIGSIRLDQGDTLMLSATREAIEALKRDADFIVAEELEAEQFRHEKIPLVLAILIGVVGTASLGWLNIATAAFSGMILLVFTGCLQIGELHEAVRWDIVFLLAGVIPLGLALEHTGGAQDIATWIIAQTSGAPPLVMLGIFYTLTVVMTQIISNNASVALMLPIAYDAAQQLSLNPFTFVLGVTFAASMGFLTPIGYQTNLMVYGPGEYHFKDFFKVGLPLLVILGVVNVFLLDWYWPLGG
jgi:di/tricarboxylate transporter